MMLTLIFTAGCQASAKASKNSGNQIMENCIEMYNEFLNGEISVSSDTDESSVSSNTEEGSKINIYDLFLLDENYNKFTFFDANQNGIPELHLSSMREYRILECIDNELKIIYSGTGYDMLLNNGALLYSRSGGAPEHISYKYTELDADNNIVQITFEKYNTLNEKDEDDLYLFEDEEITKKEFEERTKKYLTVDSDLIIWSDYWTFLVENANLNSDNKTN